MARPATGCAPVVPNIGRHDPNNERENRDNFEPSWPDRDDCAGAGKILDKKA
jgi:hypothetical protein